MAFRSALVCPPSSPCSRSAAPEEQAFASCPCEFDILGADTIPVEIVNEIRRSADRSNRDQTHEARQQSTQFARVVFLSERIDIDRAVKFGELCAGPLQEQAMMSIRGCLQRKFALERHL
jgi:hypothetical protein